MRLKCRCHGVSGSCAVQTCWKSLADFRTIGSKIKEKYERSTRIRRKSLRKLRRLEKTKRRVPISKRELVFVHRSPNYCRSNIRKGILGTRGRQCNKTSSGPDSCDLLCCGRGYNTQVVRYVERCHCKFIWCCYVECKTCETLLDKHTCKWNLRWLKENIEENVSTVIFDVTVLDRVTSCWIRLMIFGEELDNHCSYRLPYICYSALSMETCWGHSFIIYVLY